MSWSTFGDEEIAKTREELGWNYDPFDIPEEIYEGWDHDSEGAEVKIEWNEKFRAYSASFQVKRLNFSVASLENYQIILLTKMDEFIAKTQQDMPNIASRKASQNAIEAMGPIVPELFGGSADLTGSNLTNWSGSVVVNANNADGNYISWGVREFGMAAMMNGMVLHGGFKSLWRNISDVYGVYAKCASNVCNDEDWNNFCIFS